MLQSNMIYYWWHFNAYFSTKNITINITKITWIANIVIIKLMIPVTVFIEKNLKFIKENKHKFKNSFWIIIQINEYFIDDCINNLNFFRNCMLWVLFSKLSK